MNTKMFTSKVRKQLKRAERKYRRRVKKGRYVMSDQDRQIWIEAIVKEALEGPRTTLAREDVKGYFAGIGKV